MSGTPDYGPPQGSTPGTAPTGSTTRRYPYGKPWMWVAGIGVFMALLLTYGAIVMVYTTKGERVLENCVVTDKGTQHRERHQAATYYVQSDGCENLSIVDSALHKADASKAVYNSIEVGHTYTFTVVGKAFGDSYPQIIKVTETN